MDSFSRMVPANEQGSFLSNFLRQPLPPPLFTSGRVDDLEAELRVFSTCHLLYYVLYVV